MMNYEENTTHSPAIPSDVGHTDPRSAAGRAAYEAAVLRLVSQVSVLRDRYGSQPRIEDVLFRLEQRHRERLAQETASVADATPPAPPAELSIEELSRLKTMFIRCLEAEVRGTFVIDDNNRQIINDLFFWAIDRQESTSFDCTKGLLLQGDIGTGKSTLIRALRRFDIAFRGKDERGRNLGGFMLANAKDVCLAYCEGGVSALKRYMRITAAFDELGREQLSSTHFGAQLQVMGYVIESRYDKQLRTLFATNILNPDELGERYGKFVCDRLRQMTNLVRFPDGESRRR
jgi:hypothetical protein